MRTATFASALLRRNVRTPSSLGLTASRRNITRLPLTQTFHTSYYKRMASSSSSAAAQASTPAPPPSKNEWLVIAPDKPDALQRRLAVRPKHLEVLKQLQEAGILTFVGVMLGDHPKEGETPSFKGGVLTVHLDTREEVEKLLKEDVYTSNDVWDWEKVQILPFRTAIRKTL